MSGARAGLGLLALMLAACGPHTAGDPSGLPGPLPGDYGLRVDRPQGTPFEGQLIVTSDTILVVAKGSSCQPGPIQPSANLFLIRCSDIMLTIDRFGGGSPKVTATVDVLRSSTRRQCISWTDGGARCLRYETIVGDHKLQTVTARVAVTRGTRPG